MSAGHTNMAAGQGVGVAVRPFLKRLSCGVISPLLDRKSRTQIRAGWSTTALLCVLLIFFAGFAQANHVHTNQTSSTNHECSICLVAHAGAILTANYRPVPIFVRSILASFQNPSPKPLLLASFLYIRPPPSA